MNGAFKPPVLFIVEWDMYKHLLISLICILPVAGKAQHYHNSLYLARLIPVNNFNRGGYRDVNPDQIVSFGKFNMTVGTICATMGAGLYMMNNGPGASEALMARALGLMIGGAIDLMVGGIQYKVGRHMGGYASIVVNRNGVGLACTF